MKNSAARRLPILVAAVACCLLVTARPSLDAQAGFTLDQLSGAPFPSELVAAPKGSTIAWALFERGLRNIYAADGPTFRPRRLTDYNTDDGQELTSVMFSGDGKHVVYVRGGDHGSNWPAEGNLMPDPTSSPVQPKLQVWAVPLAGGAPVLLGEGDEPAARPDSSKVAFVRDGRIWIADSGGGNAPQLFFARGRNGSPAWSPDGRTLAFVSDRGDHAFIGLYNAADQPLRYLAPSTSRDSTPCWSPDGKQIAFVRRPGRGYAARPLLIQQPSPFAIWVADATTGSGHEVWHSDEQQIGSTNIDLQWAGGNRLVFMSYEDGWQHLYSVPAAGGRPLLLTPGRFMVEDETLTPDRKWILYNANAGSERNDIDRRHVWKVPVDRAAPVQVTTGTGIEWNPVVTADGGHVAYFGSDVQKPGLPMVMPMAGGNAVSISADRIPADFPASQMVTPEPVVVRAGDGVEAHCQLFKRAAGDARRPAVIFVHGGPPRQMLLGWHYMFYYANTYGLNQYLASRGFIVLSVNYRLGIGYGRAFHLPEGAGARGASEYQDVAAAARYLQSRQDVDPKRVGIYGGSYGGYLTALALGRNSDIFATGVDIHGVHDWAHRTATNFTNPELAVSQIVGDGITKEEVEKAVKVAWESSPVSAVSTWRSPVLFIHGDDDRNVPFQQTVDLALRLKAKGVGVEEMIIPDDIHDFLLSRNWLAVSKATASYLERMLMGNRPTASGR